MPYQVSMMGWVGSGRVKTFVGWVGSRNFGLGFEKVTHDQLWRDKAPCCRLVKPYRQMFTVCRQYGSFVGARAHGQYAVRQSELAYTGNLETGNFDEWVIRFIRFDGDVAIR